VPLKDRLHPSMLFGGDIVRGQEQPTKIVRNQRQVLNRFMAVWLPAQGDERKTTGFGSREELRVKPCESHLFDDRVNDVDSTQRFDARGAVGQKRMVPVGGNTKQAERC
jgi:hypothetical protein